MATVSYGHAWAALLAIGSVLACGGAESGGTGGTAQEGSVASGPVSTTAAGNGTTTVAQTSSQATTGVGGTSYVCDPPAEPGSLYELAAISYDISVMEPVSMCEFRDQVLLIVNTAAA